MSCERPLNFGQLKIFSENYKPMRACKIFKVCLAILQHYA